jgi:hypothetical protein
MLRIQVTGRLVGKNDLGLMHDGPRDRNPLLLAA